MSSKNNTGSSISEKEATALVQKVEDELNELHDVFDKIESDSNKHDETYRDDFNLRETIEYLGTKAEYLHKIIEVLTKIEEYEKRITYNCNKLGAYNIDHEFVETFNNKNECAAEKSSS